MSNHCAVFLDKTLHYHSASLHPEMFDKMQEMGRGVGCDELGGSVAKWSSHRPRNPEVPSPQSTLSAS